MKRLALFCGIARCVALLILVSAAGAARATTWQVTMEANDRFNPSTLNIVQGDSVAWVNNDSRDHTSTSASSSCSADGIWDSGTVLPGHDWGRVFRDAGTFDYFCAFHCDSGMIGTITVEESSAADARTWGEIRAMYR